MSESRVFMLNGTNVQSVVTRLESFFKTEKGMDVQSSQTTDGYVMQDSGPTRSAQVRSVCLSHGRLR